MKFINWSDLCWIVDNTQHTRPTALAKRDMDQQQDNQDYLTSCASLELYHGHKHTHTGHKGYDRLQIHTLLQSSYTHTDKYTQIFIQRLTHTLKQTVARTAQS